jgi:hypothetical protein
MCTTGYVAQLEPTISLRVRAMPQAYEIDRTGDLVQPLVADASVARQSYRSLQNSGGARVGISVQPTCRHEPVPTDWEGERLKQKRVTNSY